MTREDSILTKTWVTNDGRYLCADEIADDHLRAIRALLQSELTAGCDETSCRDALDTWMTAHASGAHAFEDEMDLDLFRVGWIQIVTDELARRSP